MTRFDYLAYDRDGKVVGGMIEADDEGEALARLSGLGLMPFRTSAVTDAARSRFGAFHLSGNPGIPAAGRTGMARQLAVLLKAGIALDRALRILLLQSPKGPVHRFLTAAVEGVSEGRPLSTVFGAPAGGYLVDETGLIKAGEQTGALAAALEDLANMLDRRIEMRGRIASVLIYPAILLVVALASLLIIGTVLVPRVMPLFEQSGAEPPAIFGFLLWLSTLFRDRTPEAALALALLTGLAVWIYKKPAVRRGLDRLLLRVPVAGHLARAAECARICRGLGSLLRSGVTLQHAMAALPDITRNSQTRAQIAATAEGIAAGVKLVEALKQVSAIDPPALQMIGIGEETNTLDTMLLHVAQARETDLARRIERFMTLLTPLLTVTLGILFGGLIMSIMGAILDLNDLAVQ